MSKYTTADIRNIALVGHAGSGKTWLAEALLHKTGAIPAKGSLERGTTVCDFDPMEKEFRHSLDAALVSLDYAGKQINLIDTPSRRRATIRDSRPAGLYERRFLCTIRGPAGRFKNISIPARP